jgi:hypothetical protein
MKNKNKLIEILSAIIGILLYIVVTVAILTGTKLGYGMVFVTSLVLTALMWNQKMDFLKLWSMIMVVYSFIAILRLHMELMENFDDNLPVQLFIAMFELGAIYYRKIVVIVLMLGTAFIFGFRKLIFNSIRMAVANIVYKPLPYVPRIAKGTRKVYLYRDYGKRQLQVIFRNSSKKKILDTYELGEKMEEEHYSLEWEDESDLIVRKYDVYNHEIVMERQYKVPKY